MKKIRKAASILLTAALLTATGCGVQSTDKSSNNARTSNTSESSQQSQNSGTASSGTSSASSSAKSQTTTSQESNSMNNTIQGTVKEGTETYRDFRVNDVLTTSDGNEIHYSIYIPDSYNGNDPYALFITLPGWEGLYFQGVGVNLQEEDFPFEAEKYNDRMIIVAPQLNDWGETSANDTITLTEYLLQAYNIDTHKVYLEGYSGGGETGSQVVGKRPDLFTAYLMSSSKWDGDYDSVVNVKLPVYLAVGENDSYYGSGPLREAYRELHSRYEKQGLSDSEIDKLLVLDVKKGSYFTSQGFQDQHAGGQLFAKDSKVMGWLFRQSK